MAPRYKLSCGLYRSKVENLRLFLMQIYCAVDGKICVNPIAPAEDFALGLKLLSVSIKAQNNGAEI